MMLNAQPQSLVNSHKDVFMWDAVVQTDLRVHF